MAATAEVIQLVAKRELAATTQQGACVVSTRCLDADGYREAKFRGRYIGMAHRIVFMAAGNVIPDGFTIDHLCRNRACLNVDHMEPVTLRENIDRALRLRHEALVARGTCANAHPWTAASTYIHKGTRYCRTCNMDARQRAKAKAAAVSA